VQNGGVLANLLPGLREVRSPLASGYIWILTVWILFSDRLPRRQSADQPWAAIYDFSATVGKPATLAAISFAAYLLGCLLEIRGRSVARTANRLQSHFKRRKDQREQAHSGIREERNPFPFWGLWPSFWWDSLATKQTVVDLWVYSESKYYAIEQQKIMFWLSEELDQLALRLQVRNAELYGNYDRAAAESDLRVNVGISTSALIVAVSIRSTTWWLFGLPVALILIIRGYQKSRQGNDVLIQAVITEEVDSRMLEMAQQMGIEEREAARVVSDSEEDSDASADMQRTDTPGRASP